MERIQQVLSQPAGKAVAVVVLVTFLILVSQSGRSRSASATPLAAREALATRALIREAAQWSTIAQQDSNPLLAVMHSTFGTAYLNVARRLYNDADIEATSNLKVDEFSATLHANQQQAVQKLLSVCPMSSPAGIAALQTGWIS